MKTEIIEKEIIKLLKEIKKCESPLEKIEDRRHHIINCEKCRKTAKRIIELKKKI